MIKINYNIDTQDNILTNLGEGFSLTWNKTNHEITHYNKNEEEEIILDQHNDNIVFIKQINKQFFLSISRDNIIKIWKINGKLCTSFEKHNSKIIGIKINQDTILSISENDSIKLWNFKGKEQFNIITNIDSTDNINLWNNDSIHILSDNKLDIFNWHDGTRIITFKQQQNFIDNFKRLKTKNILTLSDNIITLWNYDGKKIKNIDLEFNFDNLIELNDNQFAVLTTNNTIYILNENGKYISYYLEDDEFINNFKKFIKSSVILEKFKKEKTDIKQFPHIYNPLGKIIENTTEEIEKQELNFENNNIDIWNFFNRPLFTPIRKLLKKDENSTKRFKKALVTLKKDKEDIIVLKEELLEKSKKSKKIIFILFILSTIIGVGYFIDQKIYGVFILSLVFMVQFIMKGNEISELENLIIKFKKYLTTIDKITFEATNLINNIKLYRASILKQFPIIQDKTLFNGNKVNTIINNLLDNSIHKVAMEECGITQDDIIHIEEKAIILNGWSKIQNNTKKVNKHNMDSFWGVNNEIIFATQFIQYIFLTKDKIDVFNTHYDFIQNKYIRKEAHAFYYKDVTNITKKEVDRELMITNETSSATEITLKVSSGDSIEVTIFNSETLSKLNSEIKNNNSNEDNDTLEELENQRLEIENDNSLSNDEKQEDLDFIDGQINTFKSKECISSSEYIETNKVDSTIQNIRAQIKIHKQ